MSIVEMKVPTIGESITEVTLSEWLVEEGDYVELDQPICEFESDKATLEFPAEAAGTISYVASEGDDLEIGALVAKIDTSASSEKGSKDKEETSEEEGEKEKSEEKEKTKSKEEEEEKETSKSSSDSDNESYAKGIASPAAAKILREKGIDPESIKGTGKDGRITKEDALKSSEKEEKEEKKQKDQKEQESKKKESQKPDFSKSKSFSREERKEKMSRMRRTIAKRLVSAKNSTAMLTTFNEVDLTEVMKLRKTYQEKFVDKFGIKLGFMSLFAKACAKVLIEMPQVNAQLDGEQLIYHDYVDISIAISTDNGLVVPPVHNVESLGFAEVEWKIKELAEKAREGKLSLEEMQGGTFTITNGGIFGSMMSTPILNEPQSAILGMHTIQQRPVAINGEVEIRPMMYLALSYDHRVIDGSSSVTFLIKVKELLENPTQLFLDL